MPAELPHHEEDLSVIRAALAGKGAAVERLVDRLACIPPMVRARHRRLGGPLGPSELEDVIQDVLTAVWGKLDRFEGRSSLESWLYGFCVRELLKTLERRRRGPRTEGVEEDSLPPTAASGPRPETEYERLHATLERLGPPAEEVIRLKHFAALSFDEIGRRLDLPAGTVKTQYYRGVAKLRTWLGSSTWAEGA